MNLLVLNFSHFSYRYFSRCSWGIPPKPGLLINVEGSINKFKRIPIRDKFARINLHRNKSFIKNAMLFQTTLLPSFPKSFPATWLPDILNDIQPTVLHYPEIFPSHYIPSKDEVSLFPKVLLLWVKNKVQHMIIRMRVWFSNDRMIDCNHARCLFENLLKMISSSKYSDLGRICSPSLVPHLKSVYFLDGSITHWTICRHIIEPHVHSIRMVKLGRDIQFLQAVFQFTSNQALVKFYADGRILLGDDSSYQTVKDYIVFEKMLNFPYSSWKIVDRIGGFDKSLSSFRK